MKITMMTMMKIMRTNKCISSTLNNKKSVVIPDKRILLGLAILKRHHMIGYSIVSDNAHAPGPSNSIYISKTNQKLNISYISNIKALKGKFFPVQVLNKPTLKFRLLLHTLGGLFIITTIHTSLRSLFDGSKST